MEKRLSHHGFPPEVVEEVIQRLQNQKLLDDDAFASFWRQSRETFRPRSRRLVAAEIRQKGVEAEVASRAMEGWDEEAAAWRATQKIARSLAGLESEARRQKLVARLRRRGFAWDVVRSTLEKLDR